MSKAKKADPLLLEAKKKKDQKKKKPTFTVLEGGGYSPRLEQADDKEVVLKKVKDKL